MMIPYRTAKFKSTNIFAMTIWRSTAKFNSANISIYTVLFLSTDQQNLMSTTDGDSFLPTNGGMKIPVNNENQSKSLQ